MTASIKPIVTEVSEEQVRMVKLYNDDLRQSISCLRELLSAGVRTGSEFQTEYTYILPDEIDRGLVQQKIMELLKKL